MLKGYPSLRIRHEFIYLVRSQNFSENETFFTSWYKDTCAYQGLNSVQPPLLSLGGGWAFDQIFKKRGLDKISIFRGGYWERGGDFFQWGGGLQFLHRK